MTRYLPAPPPSIVKALCDADAAGLLSPCPYCQHPLQFNPFFAAADDYAEILRHGLEQSRRDEATTTKRLWPTWPPSPRTSIR